MKKIIVTGGAGYIGASLCRRLLDEGYKVISLDFRSGDNDLKLLTSINFDSEYLEKLHCDLASDESVRDAIETLRNIQQGDQYYGLIHMAAWKDLTESYEIPSEYYRNNLKSTINTLKIIGDLNIKRVIFSSSSAVYADELSGSIAEDDKTTAPSPYGYTKLVSERLYSDCALELGYRGFNLRYCNPVGNYKGITVDRSTSMFGNVLTSLEKGTPFTIFGGDYDTEDGTCIRDYIDLRDVVDAHVYFLTADVPPHEMVDLNLGTGKGVSCLEVCKAVKELYPNFEYEIGPRREGDAAGSYADTSNCKLFGFQAKYGPLDIVKNLKVSK